jgi:hypothetical protein
MNNLLLWAGRVAGFLGALMFVLTVAARLSGKFFLLDFQIGTLLQASMAVMLVGCLGYLALIARLLRSRAAP